MYAADIIDASSTNIPVAFDETAGSKVSGPVGAHKMLLVLNLTTHVLALSIIEKQIAPSSTLSVNRKQVWCPPGVSTSVAAGLLIDQEFEIHDRSYLYLRSADGSLASSGKVYICLI